MVPTEDLCPLLFCVLQALGTALYLLENMLPIRIGFVLTSPALVANGPSITYNPAVTKKKLPGQPINVQATGEHLAALVHMAEHSQEGFVPFPPPPPLPLLPFPSQPPTFTADIPRKCKRCLRVLGHAAGSPLALPFSLQFPRDLLRAPSRWRRPSSCTQKPCRS